MTLADALLYLVPDARFTYTHESAPLAEVYATLIWDGPGEAPTLAAVEAAWAAAETAVQAPYTNESTLRQQAEGALVDLRAYLALSNPTNAQNVAALRLLCRVAIGLVRLVLRKLDSTN